jgi:hypothetical protein
VRRLGAAAREEMARLADRLREEEADHAGARDPAGDP